MKSAREHLIMILECKASNRVKTRVRDRVRSGTCIGTTPEGDECNRKARCRGLCTRCEDEWRNTRDAMSPEDAASYDARLIRSGRLLPARGAKEYTNESVFKRLAQ